MGSLTSIENLPTKMAANYARGQIPYIKINESHSFSNSLFGCLLHEEVKEVEGNL